MKPVRAALVLILLLLLTAGCKEEEAGKETIAKEEALRIAQAQVKDREAVWSAELVEHHPYDIDAVPEGVRQWKVEARFPAGNREVYTLDAKTGELLNLTELEAPGSLLPPEAMQRLPALEVEEKDGTVIFKVREEPGVEAYPVQTMVPQDPALPVIHLLRSITGTDADRHYRLDALAVDPGTRESRVYPLADVRLLDSYSVDSFARFYGFLDAEHLLFLQPYQPAGSGSLVYRLLSLQLPTGKLDLVMDRVLPDLGSDFQGAGWLTADGGRLVLSSFRDGKLWVADLKERTVRTQMGFAQSWPSIDLWPSPDGSTFWYAPKEEAPRLYGLDGGVLAALPEEMGYRAEPGVLWSPKGEYGLYEFTLDRSVDHVMYGEDILRIAPQGIRMLDRAGKPVWERKSAADSGMRVEWSGWLPGEDAGVIREYRLERDPGEPPVKAGSVYSLADARTGRTTPLIRKERILELKHPEPVIGKNDVQLLVVDRTAGTYWLNGENDGGTTLKLSLSLLSSPGAPGAPLMWSETDHRTNRTAVRMYDPSAGSVTELLQLPNTGTELKLVRGAWLLSSEMTYIPIQRP
ncbi:PepSY domain-containing protein [Gorillibacterium sp. sgz5001074]|uniref:PepSY domain-containing protein n=1 Tax=Gorillibacterium sp. sgz5001074 TaxID=3446695 RepID=UPI003F6623F2